jgi:hypothetical protein
MAGIAGPPWLSNGRNTFHNVEEMVATDAEVLQEILHRYSAIARSDAIQPAFEALLGVVDEVFPIASGSGTTESRPREGPPCAPRLEGPR